VTLRELRERASLTQRDLAILLGVTEKSVQRWETGVSIPRLRQQVKLAKRFGVEVDELTFG